MGIYIILQEVKMLATQAKPCLLKVSALSPVLCPQHVFLPRQDLVRPRILAWTPLRAPEHISTPTKRPAEL